MANVYNALSRSKAKVTRERIRISLNDYVKKRASLGLQGLKGYDAWIQAMERRSADEFGNA